MQIVFLSARPELLAETLGHVSHFAPFIDDVVVIAPDHLRPAMQESCKQSGYSIEVISDEAVTGLSTAAIGALDHTSRNYRLRADASKHDALAETFIMSDDDSRPLKAIDESTFITDNNQHRRRWFYTLAGWRHGATDFDQGLLHSWIILRQLGHADPLAYASHMPQIIDKALYAEVAALLGTYAEQFAIDEWSMYFTIGPSIHPELFAKPEPFVTLAWPQYPGEWAHQITPPEHVFENFHPELYEEGGLYDGLGAACDPATVDAENLEKIMRWYRLDRQVRELAFPNDVDQPWTSHSAGRKIAFRGLRAARSAYRYVALDDRARLSELEGRIRSIEQGP
ncbi:MAG: hypothetical protein ACI81L_000353 [Verrucomicrobiales bacterium]